MLRSWEELSLAKEHYTSFLIVRDPLDRLISCYRDKMVSNVTLLISNTTQSKKTKIPIPENHKTRYFLIRVVIFASLIQ